MGCANPEGATGWNIARQCGLAGGLPISVSGVTINRFCSSGLQTIATAAQSIIAGQGDIYVAGGVEAISCTGQEMNQHMLFDPALKKSKPEIYWTMLQTAENVARQWQITRDMQDAFAPVIDGFDDVVANCGLLAEGFGVAMDENFMAIPFAADDIFAEAGEVGFGRDDLGMSFHRGSTSSNRSGAR